MKHEVHCLCGWQDSLAEFYAGKLVRCPDCDSIIEVPRPGTIYTLDDSPEIQHEEPAYVYPPLPNWSGAQSAGAPQQFAPKPQPVRMPAPRPFVPLAPPVRPGGLPAFWLGFGSLGFALVAAAAGGPPLLLGLLITLVAASAGFLTLRDGNGNGRAVVGLLLAGLGFFVLLMGFGHESKRRHRCHELRNHHVMVQPAPETRAAPEIPVQTYRYQQRTEPVKADPDAAGQYRRDRKQNAAPQREKSRHAKSQETRY